MKRLRMCVIITVSANTLEILLIAVFSDLANVVFDDAILVNGGRSGNHYGDNSNKFLQDIRLYRFYQINSTFSYVLSS